MKSDNLSSKRSTSRKSLRDYILTSRQESILIGTLLGDGRLYLPRLTACISLGYGMPQKEYFDWKVREFSPLFRQLGRIDKDNVIRACSLSCTHLTSYHSMFYKEKVKIVPIDIGKYLDSLALAVWYMDDGSIGTYSTASSSLATCCFTIEENEILIQALKDRFDIIGEQRMCQVRGNYYPTIVLFREQHIKFHEIIDNMILDCLDYKRYKRDPQRLYARSYEKL